MDTTEHLQAKLHHIWSITKSSAKIMDELIETTETISNRISKVQTDCEKWQICQHNIALTLIEAQSAAYCYHTPASITSTISGEEFRPQQLAEAIKYYSLVLEYLVAHIPEDTKRICEAKKMLDELEELSKRIVKETLLFSMGLTTEMNVNKVDNGDIMTTTNTNMISLGANQFKRSYPDVSPPKRSSCDTSMHNITSFANTQQTSLTATSLFFSTGRGIPLPRSRNNNNLLQQVHAFPNFFALVSLEHLIKHMFDVYYMADFIANDVPNLFLNHLRNLLVHSFDAEYMKEFEPIEYQERWLSQQKNAVPRMREISPSATIEAPGIQQKQDEDGTFGNTTGQSLTFIVYSVNVGYTGNEGIRNRGNQSVGVLCQSSNTAASRTRSPPPPGIAGLSPPLASISIHNHYQKYYKKGEHGLLPISELARKLLLEVSEVCNRIIIVPLEHDPLVTDLPALIASAVFGGILQHAFNCMEIPTRLLNADPTVIFLLGERGGYGYACADGSRRIVDCLFAGLDFVQDLWEWNFVPDGLHGEVAMLCTRIDEGFKKYLKTLWNYLQKYAAFFGKLSKDQLIIDDKMQKWVMEGKSNANGSTITNLVSEFCHESDYETPYSSPSRRRFWFPAANCSAHESVVYLMHSLGCFFNDYFSAFKTAINGDVIKGMTQPEGLNALNYYAFNCIVGQLQDIKTIASAALELQESDYKELKKSKKSVNFAVDNIQELVKNRICPEIFVLNNITFMINSLNQPSFSKILNENNVDDFDMEPKQFLNGNKRRMSSYTDRNKPTRLIQVCIDTLQKEFSTLISQYCHRWELLFPPFNIEDVTPAALYQIYSTPLSQLPRLSKGHRMALKQHFHRIGKRLTKEVAFTKYYQVDDLKVKKKLNEVVVSVIKKMFEKLETDLVKGREWSKTPDKSLGKSSQEWVEEIGQLF